MKVEIIGIHEDNVTTTILTLVLLLNGLLVLVAPNFRNQKKCKKKKNWMFF